MAILESGTSYSSGPLPSKPASLCTPEPYVNGNAEPSVSGSKPAGSSLGALAGSLNKPVSQALPSVVAIDVDNPDVDCWIERLLKGQFLAEQDVFNLCTKLKDILVRHCVLNCKTERYTYVRLHLVCVFRQMKVTF